MLVTLDKLRSGDVLKVDIQDNTGKIVAKIGSKLTPLLIKRLATWGVQTVDIEGDENKLAESENSKQTTNHQASSNTVIDKEIALKIVKKFSKVREDLFMDKLMRMTIIQLSNHQAQKEKK